MDVGETYQSYKATITKERSCYIQNELALTAALLKN
jgi:hypothetical protein